MLLNIVFVEPDDRRWLCLEVDSRFAGPQTPESTAYFKKILDLDPRNVAYFLYNRDISNFNPRSSPMTDYQRHQKKINFDSTMTWLDAWLQTGDLPGINETNLSTEGKAAISLGEEEETNWIFKRDLLKSYHCEIIEKFKHRQGEVIFFKTIYDTLELDLLQCTRRITLVKARERQICFPSLPVCRERFAKKVHDPTWFELEVTLQAKEAVTETKCV